METYSTFDAFWESVKDCFVEDPSPTTIAVARLTAQLAWNAACIHLCRIATDCTEWEAAQEAKEMIQ